jgi:FKBP-type peptidyl-prolyl cis-trans isomerase SlyD
MTDKVIANAVVAFHYDLFDEANELMESSRGGEPVAILHGHGAVVVGLEAALLGRSTGERFEVIVPPQHGYGKRVEGLTQRISKKHLPNARRLKVGTRTAFRAEGGVRHVTVIKVGSKMVDVDLNHPMAGMDLKFAVEVLNVREALPEEVAHGHVHGVGGHQH